MADREVPQGMEAWAAAADYLEWVRPWHTLYSSSGRYGQWFGGGQFNMAVNCVDRHVGTRGDQPAILWEGEPGDRQVLTFGQLHDDVVALANSLRAIGLGIGDRVALHLGWLPETITAMLACARIGAVHSLLPTSLPSEALAERLDDFRPRVLFTQDGAWRHGQILPLKARADEAMSAVAGVEHTIVIRRTGVDIGWYEGDQWYHEFAAPDGARIPDADSTPVSLEPDHPILAIHLANRRGRPVTVVHGTAALAVTALALHRHAIAEEGTFWCAADLSGMAPQTHGVYGPLLAGATSIMFEGTLDIPTRHRAWDIIQRYGVSILMTTPTVIRLLRGWSRRPPAASAVATLRRVVMMAEPVDQELTEWLTRVVGRGRLSVGDAWGQVQLGGAVNVDNPVHPGALPDPGFAIVDDDGNELPEGQAGELVMRNPWPGMLRSIEGSGADDIVQRHWHRPGVYSTYDLARRTSAAGRLEFVGRIDEVTSVSGQLVSLDEVRQVLLDHPFVIAAEVVKRADPRLGRSLAAAVVLAPETTPDDTVALDLLEAVRDLLGGLARPRVLIFLDKLGDELSHDTLRRTLELLTANVGEQPITLTWEQVVAASAAGDQ